MTRKKTIIIVLSIMLAILLCSIAFGTAITCIGKQKPIITLDISLKNAIMEGVADKYDYFARKDFGLYKADDNLLIGHQFSTYDIIYIEDESMGDEIQLDFWYCKYIMKSPLEGMRKIDIDISKPELREGYYYYDALKVSPKYTI